MPSLRSPNTAEAESVARQLREAAKEFADVARGLAVWSDRFDKQLGRLEMIFSNAPTTSAISLTAMIKQDEGSSHV